MEIKYFGVIIDEKLMRKTHVENQVKKGITILWFGYAFIGRTCDLTPRITLWLYKQEMIPKVTYAVVSWRAASR